MTNVNNDEILETFAQDPNSYENYASNELYEEVNAIIENPPTIAASSSPFTQQESSPNCPMRENLNSCDIYLCRIFRNMLALPFPDCYAIGNRFRV